MVEESRRRPKGTGSITRLGPGRYKVFFYLTPDKYGQRHRTSRTFSDPDDTTARQLAERELRKHLVESDEGKRPTPRGRTVGDALEVWLRDIATISVQPTTLERYEGLAERHLKPGLGKEQLRTLQPADIQRVIAEMTAKGLSLSTVRQAVIVLRQALQNEVNNDRLGANPAAPDRLKLRPTAGRRKLHRPLTGEESLALINAAAGSPLELPVLIGLYTGLRRGEIVALRWRDIDLESALLTVREAAQRIKGAEGGMATTTKEPKTDSGQRVVGLPADAVQRLKQAKLARRNFYMENGRPFSDAEFIVIDAARHMVTPNSITKRFETFARGQGFSGLRFHDLRHTYGSLMNASGVDPRTIADLMGHSTPSFSMERYVHSYDETKADAVRGAGRCDFQAAKRDA